MYSQGSLFRLSDFLRGDEKYHIARVNLTSRHDISLHYHDYAEIAWIEKGSGKHFVNGQQIALSAGDLIMIRPTDSHAYYPSPEGITLMNVAFSLESLELYRDRYFPKGGMFFWTDSALPVQLNLPMNTIHRISARGEECMKHERSYMQLDGFLLFIFRLLTDYETKMSAEGMPQWLKNAINEFNKPGYFKGGGSEFAALCNKNIDYVNRVVRKHTSMTLSELINDQKMEYARTQLIMTDMPIKEISRNCGFSSLAHFYKIFKKRYAYTPKEYRRFTQMII